MFSPKEFLRNLKDNSIKKKELRRYLYRTFRTADFYGWLFNPSKEQIVDFVGIQTEMFESITTSDKKMRCLIDVIDEHYDDLGRSTATFVWSICNFAVDTCNKQLEIIDDRFKNKIISRSEAETQRKAVEEFAKIVEELNTSANQIVKKEAKELASICNLPKSICRTALKSVPDPEFITGPKCGVYLSALLDTIYQDIDARDNDVEDIKWNKFFDRLFGKENRYDVVTFIILESNERITNFKSKSTKELWNSLTRYALDTLENCDKGTRAKMLEIYIKRLSAAVKNGSTRFRVDMGRLSKHDYPRLCESMEKFRDKYEEILPRVSDDED